MLLVQAKKLGSVAVLSVKGRIVIGETETLRKAVSSLNQVSAVILDLAQVPTVDARGLGVLLELREQVESNGIRFELTHLTSWVNKVLEITRLDTVFQITPGIEFLPTVSRNLRAPMSKLASCA
ncbi:MAG TPA: STAS domain-containing protein [Pyrinomonadaceae bacterium]|jgi:anti-anti-sigma factor|nr:STAS domain-containing protein [Pyrinomonadaceae bacterium]